MSPRLVTLPFLTTGRTMQSVAVFGGICQPVDSPVFESLPTSVSLQSVEPWSNTQLCPPPVSGSAGLLCSCTEVSGMNTEPAGAVKTLGDQLAATATCLSRPTTNPSLGMMLPSEQTAHAVFCTPSESAAVDASRVRRHLPREGAPWTLLCSERSIGARVVLITLGPLSKPFLSAML